MDPVSLAAGGAFYGMPLAAPMLAVCTCGRIERCFETSALRGVLAVLTLAVAAGLSVVVWLRLGIFSV